jgi:A/G-specific adenine glycosylase
VGALVKVQPRDRERIRRQLIVWGRQNFRSYPWRTEDDPWLTLVAEVLLQRTQARQVVDTFNMFRKTFPTARHVAEAAQSDLEQTLFRLGLHSRAEVIRTIAQLSLDNDGVPPEDVERLRMVPGIGAYTSAAWMSLHRGHRAAIVDANVYRWLGRMFGRKYDRDPRRVRWVRELAEQLTPQRAYRAFNYAVLDFTMTVCVPREPHCGECSFSRRCAFANASAGLRAQRRLPMAR